MNANNLLLWLSGRGSGSWDRYRAAVDEMMVSGETPDDNENIGDAVPDNQGFPVYRRLRVNLECLGHAEFRRRDFPNGWQVVPPTMACMVSETSAIGLLCGARSEQLIDRVKSAAANHIEWTKQDECPDRIRIITDNGAQLRKVADSVGMYFQVDAVLMLLAAIPPVDDRQFRTLAELPFGSDWDVSRFSSSNLKWLASSPDEARKTNFGLFRFKVRYETHYYLCQGGRVYRIPVQVGKYIVLRTKHRRILSYDKKNKILSMLVMCRPPLLVDRALTLCSGLIPMIENGKLQYRNISNEIAATASALLRQQLL